MIKKTIKIVSILLIGIVLAFWGLAFFSENGQILLPVKHTEQFKSENISKFPRALNTSGNSIVNSDGEVVFLKGVMSIDPAKLKARNKFKKGLFKALVLEMKDIGSNVIRIPVHPDYWISDKDYLWRNLSPIVEEAGEQGIYVVIDWHCIGNINTGKGNGMPLNENVKDLTLNFWKEVSSYFKDTPNVIFEIFNEPQDINSDDWRKNAEEIIKEIRRNQAKQIIIVGSPEFSSNLSWVINEPLKDDNVVFAAHIYPSHQSYKWDMLFGEISKKYPVLITEWGFMDENRGQTNQEYLIGNVESYGKPFLRYLQEHEIGWIACWYDYEWEPPMLKKDNVSYTNYGEFVLSQLSLSK